MTRNKRTARRARIRRNDDAEIHCDETFTRTFVAREIIRLIDRGERHKIRLAKLAIAAFEKQANAAHPWRV